MEQILNLDAEFDIKLFDEIVKTALNPASERKNEAEAVLMKFKELPGSWTKIDYILKCSERKQSKFIGLQILEENVKSKWALFSEEMKAGLRQYVFTTVIERAAQPSDIILQKFNAILIEVAKRDWPQKWPTFITDLITVSQSTSMVVSQNTLVVLKNMNEQVFTAEDDVTTTRKRLLRATLQQEYFTIFRFISLILEYSEKQELEEGLLESCLHAFRSFCKSMPSEFVFSTKIVDHVLCHLNSPHSIAALDCLLEIIELERGDAARPAAPEAPQQSLEKLALIHAELLGFFGMYLEKFGAEEKLATAYRRMAESERMFVGKYAKIFASLYALWINELDPAQTQRGLGYFVQISKIDDAAVFRDVFPTWAKLVHECYAEYPLRVPTSRPLRRTRFSGVLQAMLPVFVHNMPKPEEVFILVNDLGEIVRDRRVETMEIEFYKKMKGNLFYLSYAIEEHMRGFFIKRIEQHINASHEDGDAVPSSAANPALSNAYRSLNRLSWAVGALAGAFEEVAERDFFVTIINTLLTICELRGRREEKAIIASNIMFIIGQYNRFLKYNNDFLFVVIRKLFEFMGETYEGIKEMACDNFYKICEKCPNQFFQKREGIYVFDIIIGDLGSVTMNLDFYLQRVVLEGMFLVLKNGPRRDAKHVEQILCALTNQSMLTHGYMDGIHAVIDEHSQLMMAVHLAESYAIGFRLVPEVFSGHPAMDAFIYFFTKCAERTGRNVQLLKKSLAGLFEAAVESNYGDAELLNRLCGCVLIDYRASCDPALLALATAMATRTAGSPTDPATVQRLQFLISNIITPSVQFLLKADEHPDLSAEFLRLLIALAEGSFSLFFPLLMESDAYEPLMNGIFFSLTSIREVSSLGLQTLLAFYRACFESRVYAFFTRFYLATIENLLGLVFDKDMKNSYDLQVELLFLLISQLNSIPSLNNAGSNTAIVKEFINNLFSKNFKNLTESSLKIFIEGIFEIRNTDLFKEHLDDFNVKIYEYGSDEDVEAEVALLKERVAKSNS